MVYETDFEKLCSFPKRKDVGNVRDFKSNMAVYTQYDKRVKGLKTVGTGPSHQSNMCSPSKKDVYM